MADTSLTLNPTGGLSIGGQNLQPQGPQLSQIKPPVLSNNQYASINNNSLLQNTPNITGSVNPTLSGGFYFDPSQVSGFNKKSPLTLTDKGTSNSDTSSPSDLSQYVNSSFTTPNGGKIVTSGGAGGKVSGYTSPTGYSIDTSGSIPSSSLNSNTGTGDVMKQHSQYQDYVQGLAQAQGYSPEYISALQSQQQAQGQSAQLQFAGAGYGVNSANINANAATGAGGFSGLSQQQASAVTGQQQALNTQGQSQNTYALAQNSIQQLSANQQMQVQALIRSGNISAAESLVQASQPVGVSPGTSLVSPLNGQQSYSGLGGLQGVNAINQYNSLQQQHPDANIPAYNDSLSPAENQQLAMKAVATSPSFQSSTPEGQANISSLVQQQGYADTTNRAYQTATSNLGTLNTFMQQTGINSSDVPIINQIQNKIKAGLLAPGVVAAYQSSIAGLRAEYAQVLSRGGSVTDTERKSADTLIPDNLSPKQLATVTKQLSLEGTNAINEANSQVQSIKNRLSGSNNSSSSNGGGSSTGWY